LASWPAPDTFADEAAESEIGWVIDLITEIRSARSETGVPAGAQIPLALVSPSPEVRERLSRWSDTIRRMARLSDILFAEAAPKSSVQLLVRGEVAALPLEGVVDLAAEEARLRKEVQKIDAMWPRSTPSSATPISFARAPRRWSRSSASAGLEALERNRKILDALARLESAR
jgi:valyl-tRNA synthetase